ncbi:MAG TPA: SdrD B-like domain-containing protein [Humisphaera sp.]|jgi:uncharacterized delta-60 repeat protein|nr:SdrD B-like domain-containing protein [Humisphaera sp.]
MITAHHKWDLSTCELLEVRCLLSAGGNIDTSFGVNGYLNGYRAEALLGGSIIAQNVLNGKQGLATPDGKHIAPYSGATPKSPPLNVQADGKYLTLANGVLTRFNPNGTIDKTFGVNGKVTSFAGSSANSVFSPSNVIVHANQIYLVGPFRVNPSDFPADQEHPAVERLTLNGSADRTFGVNGLAVDPFDGDGYLPFLYSSGYFGPDGAFYTTWSSSDDAVIARFSPAGVCDGSYHVTSNEIGDDAVSGMQFEPDGKILVLATLQAYNLSLIRLNHDMTPDATFGYRGVVAVQPSMGQVSVDGNLDPRGVLLLRADGEIIVGTSGYVPVDFTIAYRPDFPANSGAVSGRFFNDINGNRKQDSVEPGLAYWQAYADLNNNGIEDAGEPAGFADVIGNYSIKGLKPGTYIIREVRQDGWTRTTPAGAWPLGYYKVTVKANQTVTGVNFGNSNLNHAKGSISGTIFNDINGDRLQDNGEPALAGWQAYVDLNDNGVYDSGEPIATADKNGHYTITGLQQGGYVVREIRRDGWSRTTPPGDWPLGFNGVNLAAGGASTGNNFGNVHAS